MTLTAEETTTHVLMVMSHEGDTRTIWNPENQDEVDAAKATFERLKDKRYLAYAVDDDGNAGRVIRDFDPRAGKIIMRPQIVGG